MIDSSITGSQYRDSTTGTTQNPDTSQIISISANPFFYKHKSHEELRWQDYQFQNEGGAAINTSNTLIPPLTSVNQSSSLFPSNPFTQQFGFTDLNKEKSIDAHSLFSPSNPFARQPGLGNAHKEESVNAFSFPPLTYGGQNGGSKLTPYTATPEAGWAHQGISPFDEKLMSISDILGKSHEELRLDYYRLHDIGGAGIGTSKTLIPSVTSANCCSSLFPSNPFTRQIDLFDRLGGESVNVVSSSSFPSNSFAPQPRFGNLHKEDSVNVSPSPFSSSPFGQQPGFGDLHKESAINTSNTLSPPLKSFNHSSSLFSSNPFTQQFGFTDLNKGKPVDDHQGISTQTTLDEKLMSVSATLGCRDKSHEELRLEYYRFFDIGGTGTSKTFGPSVTSSDVVSSSFPTNSFAPQPGFGNLDKEESVNVSPSPFSLSPFGRQPGELHKGESVNVFSSPLFSNPFVQQPLISAQREEPISISAMPAYKDKSHEELRLEYYHAHGKGAAGIDTLKTSSSNCCSLLFPSNPFTRHTDFLDRHGGESANVVSSSFPATSFAPQPGFDNLHKGESVNVFSSPFSSSLFRRQPGFGDLNKGESVNFFSSPFPSNNPFTRQPGFADLNKGESANVPSPLFPSTPWSQCSYTPSIFDSPHLPDNAIFKKVGGISAQHDEPVSISAMPAFKDKSHEELRLEYYHAQGKGAADIGTSTTLSPSITYASCCSCFCPPPFTRQVDFVDQLGRESVNVVSSSSFPSNSSALQPVSCTKFRGEPNKEQNYDSNQKDSNPTTPNEDANDVSILLPKLVISDYYTKPDIKELEAKERADPGFCSHVKDFLVGRHGYGSIKFLGETDVRNLDIEAHVRFNEREVIVYTDESKKPQIGEGLNKPAEICLVNIKCIDPKTGSQYIDGPKVNKYRELLKKAAAEEGSEFVSYDPVQGEVKFKVSHF